MRSILFQLLIAGCAFGQAVDVDWARTYGGNRDDYCSDMARTSDGGYVLVGSSTSFNGADWLHPDFWIVRTDQNGDSLWSATYGGPSVESCRAIIGLEDGGFLLGGSTDSFVSDDRYSNCWIVRIDSEGDSLWSRSIGASTISEVCRFFHRVDDNELLLVGDLVHDVFSSSHDVMIVGINSDGDSLWSQFYGGPQDERCVASLVVNDELIIAGSTNSYGAGYRDFWLLKTTLEGDSLWSRTYGGPSDDECTNIMQTSDGGFLLVGYTQSWDSRGRDIWLLKTDAAGDSLWSRIYGGITYDVGVDILEVPNSGFIIAAVSSVTSTGDYDSWIIKTNMSGDSLWTIILGRDEEDKLLSINWLDDGSYLLCGTSSSYGAGSVDFWLVKTTPDTAIDATTPPRLIIPSDFKLAAYPNPFNPATTISFSLPATGPVSVVAYDLMGRVVRTIMNQNLSAGSHTCTFAADDLPSGAYFLKLQHDQREAALKVVLVR